MIKVVHLIANLELGGAEVFVSNLIKYQKLNDIELELWCLEKSRNNEFETKVINILKKANISVIVLTEKKNKIKRIVNLVKNIRRFKPDIINSHLIHVTIYSILGKYLSLNYNLKIIETIHNTKLGNKILHKLISNYLTNKTIAITENVREILINEAKIKSEKINVIENGIEYFNQKYKLRQEVKKIIAVGRLTEQKNHIFLL
ncbi:MAG: glycosyltransferase, partial [Cetobacterium sp.]